MPSYKQFEDIHGLTPRRRRMLDNSVIHENPGRDPYVSFPFKKPMKDIFEHDTNMQLRDGNDGSSAYLYLTDEEDVNRVKKWQDKFARVVFLRDTLDGSLALDMNFESHGEERTPIGQLEYNAKNGGCEESKNVLGKGMADFISSVAPYSDADYVACVPPRPEKGFDLPTEIVNVCSEQTGIPIYSSMAYGAKKGTVKDAVLEDKWGVWEAAQLRCTSPEELKGKSVILIDDKYQSGVSINYVGQLLKEAGAQKVMGLCLVKTRRDSDNQPEKK